MANGGNVEINIEPFKQDLLQYSALSKKDFDDIVKAKARSVTYYAMKNTFKPTKQTIAAKLTAISGMPPLTVAEAMVVRKHQKEANTKLPLEQVKQQAKKIQSARNRAIAFLRSGWLPAYLRLSPMTKPDAQERPIQGARIKGKPKGSVTFSPANSWNPFVIIENAITAGGNSHAHSLLVQGLQFALNFVQADMRKYIERKMGERIDTLNRKH
jgi:hypothetical protein